MHAVSNEPLLDEFEEHLRQQAISANPYSWRGPLVDDSSLISSSMGCPSNRSLPTSWTLTSPLNSICFSNDISVYRQVALPGGISSLTVSPDFCDTPLGSGRHNRCRLLGAKPFTTNWLMTMPNGSAMCGGYRPRPSPIYRLRRSDSSTGCSAWSPMAPSAI
jgi:hypothetical protein